MNEINLPNPYDFHADKYDKLVDLLKPHEPKFLKDGFKAHFGIWDSCLKTWWNKVRNVPDPIVFSNLGDRIDIWTPCILENMDLLSASSAWSYFQILRLRGLKEYIQISEITFFHEDGNKDGIQLMYMNEHEAIFRVAEVKEGATVRYLGLPFHESVIPMKNGVTSKNGHINPKWCPWAPLDLLLDEYNISQEERPAIKALVDKVLNEARRRR